MGGKQKSSSKGGPKAGAKEAPRDGSKDHQAKDGARDHQQAKKPAEEKPSIFGKWTGKTPVTLLNEHTQRMGWSRASYNVQGGAGTSYCTVVLSKEDKKQPKPVSVVFKPVGTASMGQRHGTALEARHAAATYVLHRLRSNTNMHMSLPPAHRAYWMELEQIKKAAPSEWDYAEDPFAAKAARQKQAEERQAAQAKRAELREQAQRGHKEVLLAPGLRRRWDEMAEVHMSDQSRAQVEMVVRTWTSNWNLSSAAAAEDARPAGDARADILGLAKLGFRPQHVEEASQHTSSRSAALDWLCVHVPEDDLPEQFLRRRYQGAAVVVAPQGDAGAQASALSRRLAAKRLARSGFPTSMCLEAVELALAELGPDCAGDALGLAEARAAHALLNRLCERDPPPPLLAAGPAAQAPDVDDEVAGLEAIYQGEARVARPSAFQVCFRLRPRDAKLCAADAQVVFWLPAGLEYPAQQPAVTVASDEMPAYLKLHVARMLNAQLSADGMPVMFEAASLAEDQIEQWLAAPPPLAGLMGAMTRAEPEPEPEPAPAAEQPQDRARRRQQRPAAAGKRAEADTERLCSEFAQLQLNEDYRRMQRERERLPAAGLRAEVAALVGGHRCVVVSGATGCGKTTQVPQFILDQALGAGRYVNIVCTQPRRLSAIGVATRVAEERAGRLGDVVGYAVRGESRQSRDTRLLFCTTGVLLRMLAEPGDLAHVTHVVCDEVHERSVDSDLLLVLLRQCQQRNRSLTVVLMSATAQSERFAGYFGAAVPVVDIPGRTFPVEDVYVEDFAARFSSEDLFGAAFVQRARGRLEAARARCAAGDGAKGLAEAQQWVAAVDALRARCGSEDRAACLAAWDDRHGRHDSAAAIDFAMVDRVVRHIHATAPPELAVLVFMPGVAEIQRCVELLGQGGAGLHVLALHAGLAPREQQRVFGAPPRGQRKVVVSTNVAETSITIEDIGFVVETGRVREQQYSAESRVARLVTTFCSQAAATQRRGRAGRRQRGVCYRVYTRAAQARVMPEYSTPEIQRAPLEQVCLQAKDLGYADTWALLGAAMDAPAPADVDSAERLLVAVGACDRAKGPLLALGRWMARISTDLRLAKMLVLGAVLSPDIDRVLRLVALMSLRSLYQSSADRDQVAEARSAAAGATQSDWLADLAILERCLASPPKTWPPFVSYMAVSEARATIRTLRDNMAQLDLVPRRPAGAASGAGDDGEVLKALLLAGLSPNIARVVAPRQKYHETISGTVSIEHHARELALYAPDAAAQDADAPPDPGAWRTRSGGQRVFVHPQSVVFSEASYRAPFAAYFRLHAAPFAGGKLMLRDVTVPGVYALLLFGPRLAVDHEYKVIGIGPVLSLRAWPRIGVLVAALRSLLDELLRRRLDDPALDIRAHPVVETVLQLIRTGGAPQP
ncbi:helicase [Coemansia javaensis]|uniref:RNA helicase n=1 Tax=Coemansia javaensis TaxID=2761396 RepID=A0A9W8HGK4_9FUNG|nr:helicase [Coemansia javaensis]